MTSNSCAHDCWKPIFKQKLISNLNFVYLTLDKLVFILKETTFTLLVEHRYNWGLKKNIDRITPSKYSKYNQGLF